MSFEVQSQLLRDQAKVWASHKTATDTVAAAIQPAVGMGSSFGVLAGGNGVSAAFDTWTTAMSDALYDAGISFAYLDKALTSAANVYDDDDSTAATSSQRLDQELEPGDYKYPTGTK